MLLSNLSDLTNTTLINSCKNFLCKDEKTLYEIFLFIKNDISFSNSCKTNISSETLVYRYGNNLSKNILLYSMLKLTKFNCNLSCYILKDNVNLLKNPYCEIIPWFYVKVNLNSKEYCLDCSFDKNYINSNELIYKGDSVNYLPTNYYLNHICSFTMLHSLNNITDFNLLNYFNKNSKDYDKEFSYV